MNANIQNNFAIQVANTAKDLIAIINQVKLLETELNTTIYNPVIGINHLNDDGVTYPNGVTGSDVYSAIIALGEVRNYMETTANLYEQLFALIG